MQNLKAVTMGVVASMQCFWSIMANPATHRPERTILVSCVLWRWGVAIRERERGGGGVNKRAKLNM
jgi:hypothetical protein